MIMASHLTEIVPLLEPTADSTLDIIEDIHSGVFQDPLWSSFLDKLKAETRADYVSMIFRKIDCPINEIIELHAGKTAPSTLYKKYLEEIYRRDPVPYYDLEPGKVNRLFDLIDLSNPVHAKYVDEFLAPVEAKFILVTRITEPSGHNAWLTMCKRFSDFDDDCIHYIESLTPHLSLAMRNFAAHEKARIRQGLYEDVIHKLNFGCLTLNVSGNVIHLDEQAERLLGRCSAIKRDINNRMILRLPHSANVLKKTLLEFAANPNGQPHAIHISDDPYLDMLIVPMRDKSVSGEVTPICTAYVHGDESSPSDRCDQLMELFKLSRSEARLALALSHGKTIAEAADDIGITVETARNYSKRLFSKTGTRRQAELVRIILSSVVALA
ncbi:MAG: chemotaxis protein CheY [Hirschia sp.]|nr:chemotaxis protein CheY [Hirschia sp.]